METKHNATKQSMDQQKNQWRCKKKYFKTNENRHKIFRDLWFTAKAVLREKLIVIQAYFKK